MYPNILKKNILSGHQKRGFTMIEMIIVLAIATILIGSGITVGSKQIAKSRLSETTAFMEILDNSIEECIVNNTGFLDLSAFDFSQTSDSTLPDDIKVAALAYLTEMEDLYLNCFFDYSSDSLIKITDTNLVGFRIKLETPLDSWDLPYSLFYLYDTAQDRYYIVISSAGPNSYCSSGYSNGYIGFIRDSSTYEAVVDDDVIDVMVSR